MVLRGKGLNISTRLVLLIAIAQAALYMAFALMIQQGSSEAIEASERDTFKLLADTIRWSIQDEIEYASFALMSVTEDRTVLDLVDSRKREALYDYLKPRYEKLNPRLSHFHFHLADGVSFLRMHEPDRFGDSLYGARPMVRAALYDRRMVTGIERGSSALALRAVAPLIREGRLLGTVEYGIDLDAAFMRRLQARYEGEYFLYEFDETGAPRFMEGTRADDRCSLAERSVAELREGDAVWSLECKEANGVALYPFRDYSGRVIGFVKAELNRIPLSDAVNAAQFHLVLLGIILVLTMVATTVLSMRALLRPLRAVVAQTRLISSRIVAGDLGYRGDVSATAEEFREVIGAVNGIIASLREREILLHAIVEGIPAVVYYVDSSSRVVWANERASTVIPGIVGRMLAGSGGGGGFLEREGELLADTMAKGEIVSFEACYLKGADGERAQECWDHVAVPVRNQDGEIDHIIRISSDVTGKRRAEEELRRLNENLERRVEDEIVRRKEGERIANQQSRLAAIGELATGMAHEITQPLNAIAFSVENLRARFQTGELDAAYMAAKAEAVGADIERVRRVIDHVRLFARSAPDDYQVSFSVNRSVENALALIGVQLATHGTDMVLSLSEELPDVLGNPYQYEQVVLNLLSNARDAVEERIIRDAAADVVDPPPGRVQVTTRGEGGAVVLEVSDNGVGIREEHRSRVFDPFFTTKAQGKGTGLGMSISFGIIRDMGGSIEILPADYGARIRVSVPADGKPGGAV